jgi:bifunctional DNA-binding transcriptional regulator/antitoxin component of YhaV-PrlF toxin-antitoxin module
VFCAWRRAGSGFFIPDKVTQNLRQELDLFRFSDNLIYMNTLEQVKSSIGKRGTVVISRDLRRAYGFDEGADIVQVPTRDGVLIRPAATVPVRVYSDEDKAMFLLNNSCSKTEYQAARKEVEAMGLNPDTIKHLAFK